MITKTRLPSDIGTIVGSVTAIAIFAHSPDWTPHFIHKLAGFISDSGQIFYEIPIVLILCLGGGRSMGYLIGLLFRRIRHDTAAS